MSSEKNVLLQVPRAALWLLGILLTAPWLAFGARWLLTPDERPAASKPPAPAAAARQNAAPASDIVKCKPGPWGELSYFRTLIEPPEEFILTDYTAPVERSWAFVGFSAAQLAELWTSAGLDAAQRRSVDDPSRCTVTPGAIVIEPERDLVIGLSPAARAKIYTVLARFPENAAQNNPYRLRADAAPEWLADADLPADAVALTKRLFYPRGSAMCLSDEHLVFPLLPSASQRARYIKVLSRKSANILELSVARGQDVEPLVRYWARGRRSKDIRPLLQSMARRPNGGVLDVVHLLPPFARSLLYTYPLPPSRPDDLDRDCHWTSFNFFNDQPDDRLTNADYVRQVVQEGYYQVLGEPALGDILMLVRPDGGAVHSCVYIADDIVFTKNGPSFSVPWLLSPLDGVMAFYASDQPLEVRRYRLKN